MPEQEKKQNVLFLASWYPNKLEPQNGNFIQRHAQAVALLCNVASLYVTSSPDVKGFEIEKKWEKNVFEVIVFYKKTSRSLPFLKLKRYLKAHRLGFAAIHQEFSNIDLVHLNVFFPAGIFALYLKKKFGFPFIITEHWTRFLGIHPRPFGFFEKYYIRKTGKAASAICPVSHDLKKAIQRFGIKGNYTVIPNVVDTGLFHFVEKPAPAVKKILHVSTLNDEHKNVSGILNVINQLRKQRDDFHLTLAENNYGDKH